jgi:hypothetical protein
MVIRGFLKTDQSLAGSGHPNLLVSSLIDSVSGYLIVPGVSRILRVSHISFPYIFFLFLSTNKDSYYLIKINAHLKPLLNVFIVSIS